MLSHSVMSDSLQPHGLSPTRLLCPWGFSRQEYWSGLPFPSPGDLPNPEIEPGSPALQADILPSEAQGKPGMDFVIVNDAAATAKSLQSCPTLCDPVDGSPPGSPIPGIL